MKTSKIECTTLDLGFAAFLFTYIELSPSKINTDPYGNPEFVFRVSSLSNWEKYKRQYSTEPIINAESYYQDIVQLQNKIFSIHKSGGRWREGAL
jgi:hypothetical protein